MNPYTAPLSPSLEDSRTGRPFQALGLMTRSQMKLLVYLGAAVAAGVWIYQFRLLRTLHGGPLPLGILWPFVLILAPLLKMLANERQRKDLRQHPLVRSGEALGGGVVKPDRWRWSAREQDCLLLTHTGLVFFPFKREMEERLPWAEIERLEEVRGFAAKPGFDVHLRDGSFRRFEVHDAKRWLRAIEVVRRDVGQILAT